MATMTLTLIGLYKVDNTLFDEMTLPSGIDKETFIDSLLMKSGEFELLYPDLDFMKSFIGLWSKKWYRTFENWLKGTQASWNPIENYDRYEESTDVKDGTLKSTGTNNMTVNGSEENKVSAYDSGTYQPSGQTANNSNTNATNNNTTDEDETLTHNSHIHGNIGVTQASQMLEGFYKITEWNLYDHMSDVFIREACIPIY